MLKQRVSQAGVLIGIPTSEVIGKVVFSKSFNTLSPKTLLFRLFSLRFHFSVHVIVFLINSFRKRS